uniref:Uncharacterized protein n=1 Tax=Echeneis naucrates TaxID=173247 RepID=A0A665SY94_ECHNA
MCLSFMIKSFMCVSPRILQDSHISQGKPQDTARWEEALLCQYTMDRLFSFSTLTARVFAAGDPAHHAEGSAQRCM